MHTFPKVEINRAVMICSGTLLTCNPFLIPELIKLVFKRTNARDINQVTVALIAVRHWFSIFNEKKMKLPPNFDINFFIEGLELIFELEHQSINVKLLEMFYSFSGIFDSKFRRE